MKRGDVVRFTGDDSVGTVVAVKGDIVRVQYAANSFITGRTDHFEPASKFICRSCGDTIPEDEVELDEIEDKYVHCAEGDMDEQFEWHRCMCGPVVRIEHDSHVAKFCRQAARDAGMPDNYDGLD